METLIIGLIIMFGTFWFLSESSNKSHLENAEENKKKFLDDIKNICKKEHITYIEPKTILERLPDDSGYKYKFQNIVNFNNSKENIENALYWIDTNKLYFIGTETAFSIELNKIQMYTSNGEIQYSSVVENSGKNISLSGAIIGGAVAGTAGMVIGATKDRNNINTEIKEIDKRVIYVYYEDVDKEIKVFSVEKSLLGESFEFEKFINKELPTKSDLYLASHKQECTKISIPDEIKKYKELLDSGIITQEEFEIKKKELLNS